MNSGDFFYRERTKQHAAKMPGVCVTPKKSFCIRCQKYRTASTGKNTRAGFVCGMRKR